MTEVSLLFSSKSLLMVKYSIQFSIFKTEHPISSEIMFGRQFPMVMLKSHRGVDRLLKALSYY